MCVLLANEGGQDTRPACRSSTGVAARPGRARLGGMAAQGGPDLEAEIDDLYGLKLEEFTPARDALAKRLRADKLRDEAQTVAHLQKPNRTAWTVNQVYRREGDTFEALF